jgi:hypothetical protein
MARSLVSPSNAHCSAHLLLADNSALGVRLGEELRLVSVRCRITREETSKLQAPWDLGVHLNLGASLSGLPLASQFERSQVGWSSRQRTGPSLGACTALLAVALHYDDIDLQAVGEGFMNGQSDEELDALECPSRRCISQTGLAGGRAAGT